MWQIIVLLISIVFIIYKLVGEPNDLVEFFEKMQKKYIEFTDYLWLQSNMDGHGIRVTIPKE